MLVRVSPLVDGNPQAVWVGSAAALVIKDAEDAGEAFGFQPFPLHGRKGVLLPVNTTRPRALSLVCQGVGKPYSPYGQSSVCGLTDLRELCGVLAT